MRTCKTCLAELSESSFYVVRRPARNGRSARVDADSTCKGCRIRAAEKRYSEQREDIIAKVRARHDPQKKAAYDAEYRYRPHVIERKRRAETFRRHGLKTSEDAKQYVQILRQDPCSYCGGRMEHIDHIVPVVAGGKSDWSNLTAACASCNYSKNRQPMLTYLLRSPLGSR